MLLSQVQRRHPGTGVQHALLDRRAGRTGVHEDDDVRVGIMVERVLGSRGRDVRLHGAGVDAGLGGSQRERFPRDVDSLIRQYNRNQYKKGRK